MGTHTWNEDCPACDFGGMIVSVDRDTYFGADCPVCGYRRWTEEKMPDAEQLELAKKLLSEMSAEQLEQVLVECDEEGIALVERR